MIKSRAYEVSLSELRDIVKTFPIVYDAIEDQVEESDEIDANDVTFYAAAHDEEYDFRPKLMEVNLTFGLLNYYDVAEVKEENIKNHSQSDPNTLNIQEHDDMETFDQFEEFLEKEYKYHKQGKEESNARGMRGKVELRNFQEYLDGDLD